MAYDPTRDYAKEISAAIAANAPAETVAQLNAERNKKIAANAEHYAAKGIGSGDQYGTAAQQYMSGTAAQTAAQSGTPQTVTQSATPQAAAPQSVPRTTDDLRTLAAQQYGQSRLNRADTSGIRSSLEQSRDASIAQANEQIERGVTQGVNELARTREDALAQYQTQQNQVDADERRALDNQALYAAARGDRGGIGAEQYNSIMNAAAQNRVTINNARTKMRTEVDRQMAELRANGESAKAQAYFQAVQNYMSQLVQIEQWEQQFNVSVDQFNAEMERAYLEYLFQLQQADIATERWEREMAFQQSEADRAHGRWETEQAFQQSEADRAHGRWETEQAFQQSEADRAHGRWETEQAFQQSEADRAHGRWETEQAFQQSEADRNYSLNEKQLNLQTDSLGFQKRQYADSLAQQSRQDALARAESMMNVGMTPDAETLKAAGLSQEYAQLYISAVKAAQELSSEQAQVELEGKKADAAKKIAEAANVAGNASGGDLSALAKAYVESGATSPKTWLANNYKAYGFTSKPDNDEFEDAIDEVRAKKEQGVAADAGPGMRQSVYAGYKKYVETVLGNGTVSAAERLKAVTNRVDAMWPQLDVKQRQDLLQLLSGYGLEYVPG